LTHVNRSRASLRHASENSEFAGAPLRRPHVVRSKGVAVWPVTLHWPRLHTRPIAAENSNLQGACMKIVSILATAAAAALVSLPAAAVDADAAQKMLKADGCTKCHAVDKSKKGPSFQKVAAKMKGKANAEADLAKFLTTGPKVKMDDGSEEEHKVVKDTAGLKNLVQYILAQ
jgi:cytochrome c